MKKQVVIINLFLIILFLLINLSFVSAQTYNLKVTDEHPFWVASSSLDEDSKFDNVNEGQEENIIGESEVMDNNAGTWKKANELRVGDLLIKDNGKRAKITSIKEVIDDVEVYNLEANPFNDYITQGDVVVHNSDSLADKHKKSLSDLPTLDENNNRIDYFNDNIRVLSEEQKKAIRDVHENDKMNLFEKRTALRNAGFSDEEIMLLFETNTCGKIKLPCFSCTSGKISDKLRSTLLRRLGDSVQKSRFMKGYLDISDFIFIDSQGRIVNLNERPDIIFDNIMNKRVGVGTNPGANGIWNGVETKIKNLGNIIIDLSKIDEIVNIREELAQDTYLWILFTKSLEGISYSYDSRTDTILWPANIKVRHLDGRITDLNINDVLQKRLKTWDDSLRIGAMYDALRQRFTSINDYPVISPITEEYLCFIRAGRGYRNNMNAREVAQNLENRLLYIGEADRLFFFLQHPNLHPILRLYFVEVSDGISDSLENRACALGFYRTLFEKGRVDVNPRVVGF